MDTSKKYIKMCEKAVEIQKKWKYIWGDFYMHYKHNKVIIIGETANKLGDFNCSCCEDMRVWLPRQDQLQDIYCSTPIGGKHIRDAHAYLACLNVLCREITEFSECDCEKNFESMEQLWLAFVMREKHNLIWDKKWIKR